MELTGVVSRLRDSTSSQVQSQRSTTSRMRISRTTIRGWLSTKSNGVWTRGSVLLESLSDDDDPNAVKTACNESLKQLFRILPLLGFIVRSTSVRNSFEVFWPLLRLARQVLQTDAKLILSSEWLYSPFYRPSADLSDYVLLGFPASESSNPLLVPLAGHELGHTNGGSDGLKKNSGRRFKNIS